MQTNYYLSVYQTIYRRYQRQELRKAGQTYKYLTL